MSEAKGKTEPGEQVNIFLRLLNALGGAASSMGRDFFSTFGGLFLLFSETTLWVLKGIFVPKVRVKGENLAFQMVRVGVRAIPIVILVEMAIGMILPLQMFPKLDEFGQAEQIATINAIAAFRELGPLMTAIVLSGFAGASIAAELGTMVTSEEIEALESLALNPVRFLVVPRLLATVIMMVLLTVIADLVMIVGGWLTSLQLGIDTDVFYQMTLEAVNITGFITGLVKAAVFGLLVGLIGCYLGLSVQPWQGSEGVGKATTSTVVFSIVAIIGADAIFTVIFYAYGLFK
ncbi:MAG: ABC transporter permease [Sedimentisphaerales bacterium]|nr:ABC transporter permease [Sedimentisphaerales bacterium]